MNTRSPDASSPARARPTAHTDGDDITVVEATAGPTYSRRLATVIGVLLLVGSTIAFRAAGASETGGDSLWVAHTAWSIVHDGDLDLREYQPALDRTSGITGQPWATAPTNGGMYNLFPWGASLVAAPFVSIEAGQLAIRGQSINSVLRNSAPAKGVELSVAAMIGGVTVALMYLLLLRRTSSMLWAGIGALLFAFGTGIASTTTRALWIQGPALLVIVAWLLCADGITRSPRRSLPFALGLGALGVLAYASRPTLVPMLLIGAVIAARRDRQSFGGFAIATAISGAVFVVVNELSFGTLQPEYYRTSRIAFGGTFFEASAANLISPARGLIIWSPIVVIGIVAYLAHIRRAPLLDHLLVAWVLLHLALVSLYPQWWAGFSNGPRFMLDVVPSLLYLAAAAPDEIRSLSGSRRIIAVAACAVVAAWSIAINLDAMIRPAVHEWNNGTAAHPSVDEAPRRVWNVRTGQPFNAFPHRHAPH